MDSPEGFLFLVSVVFIKHYMSLWPENKDAQAKKKKQKNMLEQSLRRHTNNASHR